jgi:2Fe-2S ferredoxin
MIRVTFIAADGSRREVAGAPGQNLMDVAVANQVAGIDGDCGGAMACGTCHVFVAPEWQDWTGPASEFEASLLSVSLDPQTNSHLACQITLADRLDELVVHTPQRKKV